MSLYPAVTALALTLATSVACASSTTSSVPEDSQTPAVAVGQPAPNFELPDENDQTQSLEALNEGRYIVLVFNRGHW